jgi:hypothetical protein
MPEIECEYPWRPISKTIAILFGDAKKQATILVPTATFAIDNA